MKPYRIALAGCGGMANAWVQYALERQDTEIVALVDISQENAQSMQMRHNLTAGIYMDLQEAVQASGANLVFDVTIPDAHEAIVTTALRAGCDVLGEKPMAASMAAAETMVKTAQETGRMYAVMQNRRYLKTIRAIRGLLHTGEIGDMGFIGADFFLGPHFGGFRDLMDSPLILDMAIHTFDQARFIAQADPVSVYCHEYNPPGSWYQGNASALCIFEMSNGAVFNYRGSWCSEGCPTSWESSWRIQGSQGSILWDGHNLPYGEVVVPPEERNFMNEFRRIEAPADWTGREGHNGCLDEMFTALKEGRKAETDCTDNIKSIAMVFGALESARTGKKVLL